MSASAVGVSLSGLVNSLANPDVRPTIPRSRASLSTSASLIPEILNRRLPVRPVFTRSSNCVMARVLVASSFVRLTGSIPAKCMLSTLPRKFVAA